MIEQSFSPRHGATPASLTRPPKLATVTTEAGLDAVDPTAADPFGDGTLWPT